MWLEEKSLLTNLAVFYSFCTMCGNSVTINSIVPSTVVTQHGLNQLLKDKIMWPSYGNDIHKNTGQITVITILILLHLICLPTRIIGTSAPSSLFQKVAFWRPSIVKWSP